MIILTTNLGSRDAAKAVQLGFQMSETSEANHGYMKQKVHREIEQHFKPELLNRIDDTIVFHQLTWEVLLRIADMMTARAGDPGDSGLVGVTRAD